MVMINIENLSKRFPASGGQTTAVDEVTSEDTVGGVVFFAGAVGVREDDAAADDRGIYSADARGGLLSISMT